MFNNNVTPHLLAAFPESSTNPFVSSFVVAHYLNRTHEWVLNWTFQTLPASMQDMVKPSESDQGLLIHVDLFLTAEYECSEVLH